MKQTTNNIKATIRTQGFDLVGVASIAPPHEIRSFYQEWIDKGYMGSLSYIERNLERRTDPTQVLPGAQAVIMMAMNYFSKDHRKPENGSYGRIAKYARGEDYHKVHERMALELIPKLEQAYPGHQFRFYVDYGPLAERYYAQRAGLGFVGKNCNLITKEFGSWVYLSGIITDLPLHPDTPQANQCGTCIKCLDSCPTQAFAAPFVLDSTKCISYMTTIQYKSQPPKEIKEAIQPWVFGCDVCQNCCPFNVRTPETTHEAFKPLPGLETHVDSEEAQNLPEEAYFEKYKKAVIRRWTTPPKS